MGSCCSSQHVSATQTVEPNVLNLSKGQLKALKLPPRPKLDRITHLDASYNALSGSSFTEDFDALTRLEFLDLSYNPQLTELPAAIANCPITSLNISYCGFTEFPEIVLSLQRLRQFNCSGHPQLALPNALRDLKMVEDLRLLDMGFYFWPSQLNGLPLSTLHIGGRQGHPIRLNRSFPKLPPTLVDLRLDWVDFRGACCYRERKTATELAAAAAAGGSGGAGGMGAEAGEVPGQAPASPPGPVGGSGGGSSGQHLVLVARTGAADSTKSSESELNGGGLGERESSIEAKTMLVARDSAQAGGDVGSGLGAASGGESQRLHIELQAADGGAGAQGQQEPSQGSAPPTPLGVATDNGDPPSRRPSIGVGRLTGGGLSTLLPSSLVHMMVNRRPGSGNERAHKTTDLPDNLLGLVGLQRLTLRHMHLRSLGGIARLRRLTHLDVHQNNIRYLTPELAELEDLKSCRLSHNYTADFFIERGFPHQSRAQLHAIEAIPPGVPGLATIDALQDYVTREAVLRTQTHTHVTYESATPGEPAEQSDDSDVEAEVEHELQRLVASQSSRIRAHGARSASVSVAGGGGGAGGAGGGAPVSPGGAGALSERGSFGGLAGTSSGSGDLAYEHKVPIPGEVPQSGIARRIASSSGHSRTSSTNSQAGAGGAGGTARGSEGGQLHVPGSQSARSPLSVSHAPPPRVSVSTQALAAAAGPVAAGGAGVSAGAAGAAAGSSPASAATSPTAAGGAAAASAGGGVKG